MSASRLLIEDCAIATVAGEEYEFGYVAYRGLCDLSRQGRQGPR